MLFAFLDESYTKDRYYLSAVVVDEADIGELKRVRKETLEYASGFGVAPDAELHAHSMMTGCDDWKPIQGQHRAAIAIYRRALTGLATLPAKVYVEGVDVVRLNSRYRYPRPPHVVTLQHVLERVNAYARLKKTDVKVIADEIQGQASHIKRAETYQLNGTGGFRSSKLGNIEMPLKFGASHQSPGLQMADLVAYIYRRRDAHVETDARAAAAVKQLCGCLAPLRPTVRRWDP